ncbi:MAG TPA: hypothetical protein VGQ76_02775 [Thermoanaerobaculia bacterium]|jgi:hypothetical protein|nr:hypothetical protein [Thermoanaerobaculia bacterium]
MLLLAAVLTASMNIDLDLSTLIKRSQVKEPTVTCGIVTVGYRFRGKPGQTFRYAGDKYEIPEEGSVELIADRRRTTYAIDGKSLPLDVWPRDPFGFRDVPLPSVQAPAAAMSENRTDVQSQNAAR